MSARIDLNVVKTPASGGAVLLAPEEAEAYRDHLRKYVEQFAPVGARESELVQSLADLAWRTNRLTSLEMNIYAVGRAQFAREVEDRDPQERPGLLQVSTYLAYEKQLRNLQTQEARLRRYSEKDLAELKALQGARHAEEQALQAAAAELYLAAQAQGKSFDPAEHGFEFSTVQIERFIRTRKVETAFQSASLETHAPYGQLI